MAGVGGVPLDALVQRDAQRQLRRVTAIMVAPLTLVAHYGLVHRMEDMIAGPAIAGLSTFLPATPGGTLTLSAAFAHAYAIVAGPEVRMPVVGDAGGQTLHALCVMG